MICSPWKEGDTAFSEFPVDQGRRDVLLTLTSSGSLACGSGFLGSSTSCTLAEDVCSSWGLCPAACPENCSLCPDQYPYLLWLGMMGFSDVAAVCRRAGRAAASMMCSRQSISSACHGYGNYRVIQGARSSCREPGRLQGGERKV